MSKYIFFGGGGGGGSKESSRCDGSFKHSLRMLLS